MSKVGNHNKDDLCSGCNGFDYFKIICLFFRVGKRSLLIFSQTQQQKMLEVNTDLLKE